ncbi:hypothetical protein GLO73106DRAFT_00035700 [Gloeocapsa sp. PCC 73106]|nr:hypothetical protein [Gloeocapsa sp. PCC 73106]ELR99718.1 hypothetical protein GLO73106DRAFT_00035700 [Gloeocapsa sp. PCC 73106]
MVRPKTTVYSVLLRFKRVTLSKTQLITELQPVVTEEEMIQAVKTLLLGLGESPERCGVFPYIFFPLV